MFLLILINLEVNLHKQHLQQILRNSYIETYQKSIMSYEKYRIANTVGHYDFHMRGLHFAAEKEESLLLLQMFQKS
jgi:adenine-specific DNA methylase